MDKFRVLLTDHAIADLKEIPKEFQDQIHGDIKNLQSAALSSGPKVKRLEGFHPPVYRLRSGDYRVLYHIQGNVVNVLRVIDRKLLERVIKRLNL
jgi:mRNA-degrading endonuclease RelE of RelBE toxin-antitoxin system